MARQNNNTSTKKQSQHNDNNKSRTKRGLQCSDGDKNYKKWCLILTAVLVVVIAITVPYYWVKIRAHLPKQILSSLIKDNDHHGDDDGNDEDEGLFKIQASDVVQGFITEIDALLVVWKNVRCFMKFGIFDKK
jgi:hypothetical protein